VSLSDRIRKLEERAAAGARCPGPPIEFRRGTREQLDAMPSPACPLCGRRPAEHEDFYIVEVLTP
jgi:hypothetical protein